MRTAAGIFDVSHMGEFRVAGEGAEDFLQRMTPNDVAKLQPGRIHYSGLLTEEGTYVDDLLIYRLAPDEFLLVVNAANSDKDLAWLQRHNDTGVTLEDVSSDYGLIALQGPKAAAMLSGLTDADLDEYSVLRFRAGRGRRPTRDHLPHRLHRRGRVRALPGARGRVACLGCD